MLLKLISSTTGKAFYVRSGAITSINGAEPCHVEEFPDTKALVGVGVGQGSFACVANSMADIVAAMTDEEVVEVGVSNG